MSRSKGIGGTDIGCIVGVNPWKSIMDLYLEKVGITEPQEMNEAMELGLEMEPILRKRYEKKTGPEVWTPSPGELPFTHPLYDWYKGSPDDLVGLTNENGRESNGGVDYKTTGRRNDYGEPGTDDVPPWVGTQCQWYMGLTGAEWWDVAVLFFSPRREFQIYRLQRNQEIIDNLTEAGREFWEGNVIPRIPPALDASEGSKRLLAHLYPRDVEDLFAATPEIEQLAEDLSMAEAYRDSSVENLVKIQNKMKAIIGSHSGVVTSCGKITWKKQKDREVTDWKLVADRLASLLPKADLHLYKRAIDESTTTTPGPRVFRAWWKKED